MGADKHKVQRYVPKNNGVIHAVLWTGKAECLLGLPDFNEVVAAIESIDRNGHMRITCTGDESVTNVRPFKDYVGLDGFDLITVWTDEFIKRNYDLVPDDIVYRSHEEAHDPYDPRPPFDTDWGRQ